MTTPNDTPLPAATLSDHQDCTRLRLGGGKSRGLVLVAMSRDAVRVPEGDPLLFAHTLFWESREICRVLMGLGFDIDVIDFDAPAPAEHSPYVGSVTLHHHLLSLRGDLAPGAMKIMWLTGSHPEVQNAREMERIRALEARRDCVYEPKRQIPRATEETIAFELADRCVLIGNDVTLATYPPHLHAKIARCCVSAANVSHVKPPAMLVPPQREFVWFSASSAVHKGLDLLLDLFGSREFPTLHVVGALENEPDFLNIYDVELNGHPRIRYHGFLRGNDPALAAIFDRCVGILHPSASEGMSGSVAHCLEVGLYPIISRATGIDLPPGCGRYLDRCSHDEIAAAIEDVLNKPEKELAREISVLQEMALARFSREAFSRRLWELFGTWFGPGR